MDKIKEQARSLLDSSQAEECIGLLIPECERLPNDVPLLQLLAEAYIEYGDPQNAYILYMKSAELDPEGDNGYEKFLWLGQLCGDKEGIDWFEKGLDGLRADIANVEDQTKTKALKKKMCESICSMIEIWMTDLCEEEEAEQACEKLITEALMVDDSLPENWSILGSIRVQQQRDGDAVEALTNGWKLYEQNLNQTSVDDLATLIRLGQCMLEVSMLGEVLDVTQLLVKIDEQVPDAYYLNGLAHYNLLEQEKENGTPNPRLAARHAAAAREAFGQLIAAGEMEVDPEMVASVKDLIKQIPDVKDGEFSDSEDDDDMDDDVRALVDE